MNKRRKVIIIAAIVNLIVQGVLLSLSIEKGWQVYETRFWPFSGLYHETESYGYTDDITRIANPTRTKDEAIFVKSAYEFRDVYLRYDNRKIIGAIVDTGSNIEAYQALTGTNGSDVFLESLERAWSRGVPISEIYDRLFENFLERITVNSLDNATPHVTAKEYFLLSNLRMSSLTEKDIERIFPIRIRDGYNWLMGYNRTEFLIYGLLLSTLLVSFSYLQTTDKSD